MADEDKITPANHFVSAEMERRRLKLERLRMRAMGDAPIESDWTAATMYPGSNSILGWVYELGKSAIPDVLHPNLGLAAAVGLMVFQPETIPIVAPFLVSTLTGEIGGEGAEAAVNKLAPGHPVLAESANLVAGTIGFILGDPAAREALITKFGKKAPEALEQIKNIVGKSSPLEAERARVMGGVAEERTNLATGMEKERTDLATGMKDERARLSQPSTDFEPIKLSPEEEAKFVKETLAQAPDGDPGLFVVKDPNGSDSHHVIYRGPDGKAVSVAVVQHESYDPSKPLGTIFFVTDKSKGLLASRASVSVGQKLQELGAAQPLAGAQMTSDSVAILKHASKTELPKEAVDKKKEIENLVEQVGTFEKSTKPIQKYPKEVAGKIAKVEEGLKSGGIRHLSNLMYDSELWNPRISLAKAITDTMMSPTQVAFRGIGVSIEHGTAAGAKVVAAAMHAYKEALPEAIKFAAKSFKEDRPAFQESIGLHSEQVFGGEGSEIAEKFEESPTAHAYRWIHSAYSNTLGAGRKAIMSADQFEKAISYRANKRMEAYILALGEADKYEVVGAGKLHYAALRSEEMLNQVGTDISHYLDQRAKSKMFEATFTDQGKFVKAATKFVNDVKGLNLFIQYLRTPLAIGKRAVEMSPFAPATSSFRQAAGVPILDQIPGLNKLTTEMTGTAVDQSEAIAKWAVGTMLYSKLGDMAANGIVIGDGPQGELRKTWPDRDHANSIKIGDYYLGTNRLGPFGLILSFAADASAAYHQTDDGYYQEGIVRSLSGIMSEKAEDMPFLESFANLTHALDSVHEGKSGKAASEFFAQEVSGFIPAPVRIIAHAIDPVQRQVDGFKNTILSNIPGWSKTSGPAKRDNFGHPMYPPVGSTPAQSATKTQRLLNNLNPVPQRGDTDHDEVDKELFKYGVTWDHPPNHVNKGPGAMAVNVPISDMDRVNWERNMGHVYKVQGKNQHDYMLDTIHSDWYKHASPGEQSQRLHNIHTFFKHATEPQIPIAKVIDERKAMMQKGGEPGSPGMPIMQINKSMQEMKAGGTPAGAPSGALPPTEVK